MPVLEFEAFAAAALGGGVVAGLDLGTKTIGLAVSDRSLALAHPRTVVRRTKFAADASVLLEVFAREGVCAVVIGHPINMDGSDSARAQSARAFARNFERFSAVPFHLWDERLSTVAAERSLLEMDVSRAKRAERIDSAAAAFILQGVLDRLRASH
jgi:putative holliday junction resolvase